jgi:hypothetical protein
MERKDRSGILKIAGMAVLLTGLGLAGGCKKNSGPDRTGAFVLSSQLYGVESYYIYGYRFEDSEMYRYPFAGDPLPDIINEGFLAIDGENLVSYPGFNTPAQENGFALAGEFGSLDEARTFYNGYTEVGPELEFVTVSDTVKLFQVWIQQTSAGNFAKMLIKEIHEFQSEGGRKYNDVVIDYTYQPDGSRSFGN